MSFAILLYRDSIDCINSVNNVQNLLNRRRKKSTWIRTCGHECICKMMYIVFARRYTAIHLLFITCIESVCAASDHNLPKCYVSENGTKRCGWLLIRLIGIIWALILLTHDYSIIDNVAETFSKDSTKHYLLDTVNRRFLLLIKLFVKLARPKVKLSRQINSIR